MLRPFILGENRSLGYTNYESILHFSLRYQRLLKARALDPLSQRKLSSVQSKYLYLEQQIEESNMKLDLEWEEHLDKCKVLLFCIICSLIICQFHWIGERF